MNHANKSEKIETLPVPVNNNSNLTYSDNNKLSELTGLKEETINGFKFRHVFHDETVYCVVQDVYSQLGNKDPKSSAGMFHLRNKDLFDPESFRKFRFITSRGRRTYLTATLEVVSFICARTHSKKGDNFLIATGKFMRKFSEGKISLSPSHETINLILREWSFQNALVVKDLDQIKSVVKVVPMLKKALEDLAVMLQSQIDSQNETPTDSKHWTIGQRKDTIYFLIKSTALKEGVYFNKICNEFKKVFLLRKYSDLTESKYKEAIKWFNERHDQMKKGETKKSAKLDNWFKGSGSFPQGNKKGGIDA